MAIRFPLESVTVTTVVRSRNVFRYGFEFDQPKTGKELTGKELIKKAPERPDSP